MAGRDHKPVTELGQMVVRGFFEKQKELNTQSLGVEHLANLSRLTQSTKQTKKSTEAITNLNLKCPNKIFSKTKGPVAQLG